MGAMFVVVVTRMSSYMPVHHERIGNFFTLFASRIYSHKNMVSIVGQRMLLIIFMQSCVINFWQTCTELCRNCVTVCAKREGESHFGNSFMV
jgi:hypothetical protein